MFAINNIILINQPEQPPLFKNKREWITFGSDALIVIAIVTIGGVAIGIGVGVMSTPAAFGLCGGGVFIVLIDALSLAIRMYKKRGDSFEEINSVSGKLDKGQITKKIKNAEKSDPTMFEADESAKVPFHPIINCLNLGSGSAFIRSTNLKNITEATDMGQSIPVSTSNAEGYSAIITVCPLYNLDADFDGLVKYSEEEIRNSFSKGDPKVEWTYVGRLSGDDTQFWEGLVYDCTCPDSELAKKREFTRDLKGIPHAELVEILKEKKEALGKIPVNQWFEPIFTIIDRAVFNNEKVLVHCRAGKSRSAILLAAYLVNRFQVSADEALNYLRMQRACVAPKFIAQLEEYAAKLKNSTRITIS